MRISSGGSLTVTVAHKRTTCIFFLRTSLHSRTQFSQSFPKHTSSPNRSIYRQFDYSVPIIAEYSDVSHRVRKEIIDYPQPAAFPDPKILLAKSRKPALKCDWLNIDQSYFEIRRMLTTAM